MNRRGFIGSVLSTGLASVVLPRTAAQAQAGEIRIGMSAAFRGAAAGLGSELYRGAQAYYSRDQRAWRPLRAARSRWSRSTTATTRTRASATPSSCWTEEKVFLLSNYVGTPTLTRALPVIKQYADQGVVLVGNFTGAQPQREAPYVDQVFNVRASYRQEMSALVERFWQAGARRFGVYYQIDAYGRSGTDGVARALAARNAKIVAEATYVRNAKFEEDMTIAVQALREAGSEVVLCTGAYQGCAAFVRSARDAGWTAPISNVSFVGSDAMLGLLVKHGRAKGRDYTRALINSQVVPSYDDTVLPGVLEYRALMDKHNPQVPEALRDAAYAPQKYSFISLEGYVNARVIVEALRRAGSERGAAVLPAGAGIAPTASTSESARRSPSAPSGTRGWTASTSRGSRAIAGCRSPTGPPRSRHEHGHGRLEARLEKARVEEGRGGIPRRGRTRSGLPGAVRPAGQDHPLPRAGPAAGGDRELDHRLSVAAGESHPTSSPTRAPPSPTAWSSSGGGPRGQS